MNFGIKADAPVVNMYILLTTDFLCQPLTLLGLECSQNKRFGSPVVLLLSWIEVISYLLQAGPSHHWFRRGAGRLFRNNQPTLIS